MRQSTPALYGRLGKDENYRWVRVEFLPNGTAIAVAGATSYFLKGTFKIVENGQTITKRVIPAGKDFQETVNTLRRYDVNPTAAEMLRDFQNGQAAPSKSGKTLGQAIGEYLGGLENLKPDSITDYRTTLSHALAFFGADKPLAEFDREALLKYRKHLYQKNISEQTRLNRLVSIATLLKKFKFVGLLEEGDWPDPPEKKPAIYTSEEIDRLIQAATTRRERLLIETFLYSGARDMEVAHLTADDIEIQRRANKAILHIRIKDDWSPKNKKERDTPIPLEFAERLLAAYEAKHLLPLNYTGPDSPLLFPNTLGRHDKNLLNIIKRVAKGAGVKKAWLHKFRATSITLRLRAKNGDIATVQEFVGHEDIGTTKRYWKALQAESDAAKSNTDEAFGTFAKTKAVGD